MDNHIKREWFVTSNASKVALSIIDSMEPNLDGESLFDNVFQELGDRYNIFAFYTPQEALVELCTYELVDCGFDKKVAREYCNKLDEMSLAWLYLNDEIIMPDIKAVVDSRDTVTLDDIFLYFVNNEIHEIPPTLFYAILNKKE